MLIYALVKPNQRYDQILWNGQELVVRIKAAPKDGQANKYLLRYVADTFGVAKTKVGIVRGEASSRKALNIELPEAVVRRVLESLPSAPRQASLF